MSSDQGDVECRPPFQVNFSTGWWRVLAKDCTHFMRENLAALGAHLNLVTTAKIYVTVTTTVGTVDLDVQFEVLELFRSRDFEGTMCA
ncbi:putative membrane protein [Granulicella aggregans]|uniref:Putative membrane protein n=1 Tax=Granulicella aggregans TaxID=474949 RepID=A0A7W8E4R3_9BACT|nr:putative membrane protein [Granulicella aggregans]